MPYELHSDIPMNHFHEHEPEVFNLYQKQELRKPRKVHVSSSSQLYLSIGAGASTASPCLYPKHIIEQSTDEVMMEELPGVRMTHQEGEDGEAWPGCAPEHYQVGAGGETLHDRAGQKMFREKKYCMKFSK